MSWLAPTGVLDFKYYPFIPLYFHMPSCCTNGDKLLWAEGVFLRSSSISISYYIQVFLFLLLSLLPTPVFLSLSLSRLSPPPYLPLHLSIPLSHSVRHIPTVSLFCILVLRQTKAGHVGMHVQQIWWWLCDSRDEPLEQLHSSLIRWHTDANQNHNALLLTPSPPPWVKGELWKKKTLFLVIWVSVLSQITKGSE